MSHASRTIGLLAVLALGGVVQAMACAPFNSADECDFCAPPGTGGAGTGGSGGGTPPECVPSENDEAVLNECGVFVSSSLGADGAVGTKEQPLRSLGEALMKANGQAIYACAETYAEAIELPAGGTVFGGLDCANDWRYIAGQKATIAPGADLVPVTLLGGEGARLEDVAVIAADATVPGGSSIAMIAQDGAAAEVVRCELRAGAGAPGAEGTTPTEVGLNGEGQDGENGIPGTDSTPACMSTMGFLGGAGGQRMCGEISVSGGLGGAGLTVDPGGDGSAGQPQPGPMPPDGKGGKGQADMEQCDSGEDGAQGTAGLSGLGATGIGGISASGYSVANGSSGMSVGMPGQGGGGGGGAKTCGGSNAGPSGGGGGSGGCGGAPGTGGAAGGSSIGLLSHNATVNLTGVIITTAAGGEGGLGGNGQPGGGGGQPGLGGGADACQGGKGGAGGRGGSGGGGLGGHAIGIAFKGTAPVQNDVTFTMGAPGMGGIGGDGDMTAKGADGQACATLSFDEPGSCM